MMINRCLGVRSENAVGSGIACRDTGFGKRWRPHPGRVFAVLLFVGNLFLHKPLSDVCDTLHDRFGFAAYNRAALGIIGTVCAVVFLVLTVRAPRSFFSPRAVLLLFTLAALTIMAQRWLLVANIELIHFPQYGLLTGVLIAGGVWPICAWLGATLAGIADELYQYVVIYAGRQDVYLDFNDMVLNALGAAWAVLLYPSRDTAVGRTTAWGCQRRRRVAAFILAVGGVVLVSWIDPPCFAPMFRIAATGLPYHAMSASEAFSTTVVLWIALRWAEREQCITKVSAVWPGARQTDSEQGDFQPS